MDLFCIEFNVEPKAISDPVFLDDQRILKNLMDAEERYVISSSYFKCLQTEIKPFMRKVVATWMLEVCEEMNCEDVVFPMAINFLDRLLMCTDIRKNQLQLVGVVCLLIASKLRQTQNLEPNILSYFTDYSVTVEEIIGWELLVLKRLKWDVSSVVAIDYIDYLLARISSNITKMKSSKISSKSVESIIRRHSSTFISLCSTEFQFSCCLPSLIAAASIATAVKGLLRHNKHYKNLINILADIVVTDPSRIDNCVDQIESLITSSTSLSHKILAFNQLENNQVVSSDGFAQITSNIHIIERKTLN